MSIVIRGDFHRLKAWAKMFEGTPELLKPMSKDMAEELLGKVQDGFRDQRDPYGQAWAPKKIPDGRAVLVGETTRLRRGWHVEKTNAHGFKIIPSVKYAIAHQDPQPRAKWGGKALPRRAMVPFRGLPDSWKKDMKDVVRDHFKRHFTSARRAGGGGMSFLSAKLAGVKRSLNPIALAKRVIREVQGD